MVNSQVNHPLDLRVDLVELGLEARRIRPGDPAVQLVERYFERALRDLLVKRGADAAQYGRLEPRLRNLHRVLAAPAIAAVRAAPNRTAPHRVKRAAALRALEEPSQESLAASTVPHGSPADLPEAVAHVARVPAGARPLRGMPELVGDNPPLLVMLTNPFRFGAGVGDSPAGRVILYPLESIPDPLAAIERVAQHLANGRGCPRFVARGGRPLRVETMRERAQPESLMRVAIEDPAHDLGAIGHHHKPVAVDDLVAVRVLADHDRDRGVAERDAARSEASIEAAVEPAVRISAHLLKVLLRDHAHHAGSDVVDRHPGRRLDRLTLAGLDPIADPAEILLIPGEPREVVGQENVPLAHPIHEREQTRSIMTRGARDPVLFDHEIVDDTPPLSRGIFPAARHLIFRRLFVLSVR